MKKLMLYVFVLMICLAAACKKDIQNKKIYLLKQEIVNEASQNSQPDTTTYTYDDNNRMKTIVTGTHPGQLSYTISYDGQGRVSMGKKFNNNGSLVIEYDFFYRADTIGYYSYGPNFAHDTTVLIFNDKKQMVRKQTKQSGYQVLTYDSRGNVSTLEYFNADGSNDLYNYVNYEYDAQKNTFADMAPNNYFFMYLAYDDESSLINNVVIKNADTYIYTYNSDGFPTKAQANVGRTTASISYNYIIK
jgi:hypothetical protein